MKYLLIIPILLMFNCTPSQVVDINQEVEDKINAMKSPVILIAKEKSFNCYGVTLKDSDNKILIIGNLITVANQIGESRKIGDTIR